MNDFVLPCALLGLFRLSDGDVLAAGVILQFWISVDGITTNLGLPIQFHFRQIFSAGPLTLVGYLSLNSAGRLPSCPNLL